MEGVTLRNIDVVNTPPQGNFLFGYDNDHKILNVVFDNVRIAGTELTGDNIRTYFDPLMSYSRGDQLSHNLEFVEYSFE